DEANSLITISTSFISISPRRRLSMVIKRPESTPRTPGNLNGMLLPGLIPNREPIDGGKVVIGAFGSTIKFTEIFWLIKPTTVIWFPYRKNGTPGCREVDVSAVTA